MFELLELGEGVARADRRKWVDSQPGRGDTAAQQDRSFTKVKNAVRSLWCTHTGGIKCECVPWSDQARV
jgi:hypothetical protein